MKKLNYIGQDGIIIHIEDGGKVQEIRFSDIEKYWDYANEDDFEGGSAWDLEKNSVVHISNGEFCKDFALYNDMVYSLCEVCDFNCAAHFLIFRVPFGTINSEEYGTRLYCESPCRITGNPALEVGEKGIQVISEDKEYIFASSTDGALIAPAIGFEKYYESNAMADYSMSGMLL